MLKLPFKKKKKKKKGNISTEIRPGRGFKWGRSIFFLLIFWLENCGKDKRCLKAKRAEETRRPEDPKSCLP